jgi:hypothetical protein
LRDAQLYIDSTKQRQRDGAIGTGLCDLNSLSQTWVSKLCRPRIGCGGGLCVKKAKGGAIRRARMTGHVHAAASEPPLDRVCSVKRVSVRELLPIVVVYPWWWTWTTPANLLAVGGNFVCRSLRVRYGAGSDAWLLQPETAASQHQGQSCQRNLLEERTCCRDLHCKACA